MVSVSVSGLISTILISKFAADTNLLARLCFSFCDISSVIDSVKQAGDNIIFMK